MATILNEQRSDYGSPYVYYSVSLTEVQNSRTADSVKLNLQVDTHLASSQSSLGTGKSLIGYIYFFDGNDDFNGIDIPVQRYQIDLKSSGDSWSGTSTHTQTKIITINDIPSSLTILKNIKFRVARGDSSGNSGIMSAKDCSNFTITIGHIVPSNVQMTMVESNPLLVSAGISNTLLIENLSQKTLTFTYELHDEATMERVGVYNRINPYSSTTNPFVLDLSTISLEKDTNDNTKIPLMPYVKDSFNTQGLGLQELYSYITYTPINITNTNTFARRYGQTSGRVKVTIDGLVFNGVIGNIDQSSYKPTIKYKYWVNGESEPSTYNNTISSSDITISNGQFNVSGLDIGSSTESDPNYFNPENSYKIKILVQDNFTQIESNELVIPQGYSIWDEYKDRVNIRKLEINHVEMKDFQSGSTDLVSANPNTYTDTQITFEREFLEKPKIFYNVRGDASSTDNGNTIVGVLDASLTTTGATLRYYNRSSSTRAMYIDWMAVGTRKY